MNFPCLFRRSLALGWVATLAGIAWAAPVQSDISSTREPLSNEVVTVLGNIDKALAGVASDPARQARLLVLKATVLSEAGLPNEADAALEQAIRAAPEDVAAHHMLAASYIEGGNSDGATEQLLWLARNHPDRLDEFETGKISALVDRMDKAGLKDRLFDLESALIDADYGHLEAPGDCDWMIKDVLVGLIVRNRTDDAKVLVARLIDPDIAVAMLIDKRFEALWPTLEQRAGPDVSQLSRTYLAAIEARLLAQPDQDDLINARIHTLVALGRYRDAIEASRPFTDDPERVKNDGGNGFWRIEQRSIALANMGRLEEANALFDRYGSLDFKEFPGLIGPAIDRAYHMFEYGHYRSAIARSMRLDQLSTVASPYGRMVIARIKLCSFHALGRVADEQRELAYIESLRADSEAVYMLAMLCLDRADAAERSAIGMINDPAKRTAMLKAFQDRLPPDPSPVSMVERDVLRLRERPAVVAAIEQHGRLYRVPKDHPKPE
jgi:tetratricopeptide (TPR) repeat protein